MINNVTQNKFEAYAQRSRLWLLLMAVLVVLTRVLPMPGLTGVSGYLPLHMLFETGAIIIATMVFVLGWNSFRIKPDNRLLMMSTMFLGVAVLDFFHMLSFDGMPDLVTPGSPEKGINYWLAARFMAAVALLVIAILPRRASSPAERYIVLAAVLLILLLCNIWFLYFPETVPVTYIEGSGLTRSKIVTEYILVVLYVIAGLLLWRRAVLKHKIETLMLASSAFVMALSEVFFTFYATVSDIYNVLGHVYKIIAYSYLFRSVVLFGINEPFHEVAKLSQRIQATLDALPDMVFELSVDGTILDYHSHAGEKELVAPPELFLGHNVREFLPETAVAVFFKAMDEIMATGLARGMRYSLMMPKGERWFELSGASLASPGADAQFIMVVRDITDRQLSEMRTSKLLELVAVSADLDEEALARKAIDLAEALTHSKIGFLHMINDDRLSIELLAWSTRTGQQFCHAEYNNHYPIDQAGIWADCVKLKKPIVVNDYSNAANKKGLPDGHSQLTRFISVPVIDSGLTKMIIGVGNCDFDYDEEAVNTVQLFGNELYQIVQRRRAQRDAERSQRILRAALDNLPVGVAINSVGEDVNFEYMNNNFPLFYRTSREQLGTSANFWDVVYEDPVQREHMRSRVINDVESGDLERMKWTNIPIPRAGCELRFVTAQNVLVPEEGLSVSLVSDVTETLRVESELRIAATAFSSQEGIMITDAQRNILRVNESFEKRSGFTQSEVAGLSPAMFKSGHQGHEFYDAMWDSIAKTDSWRGEVWNRRKNGEIYPQTLTITAVRNNAGDITNYVADYVDLTELKQAEQTISKLSYFDSLTGLPNRGKFLTQLSDSVAQALSSGHYAALVMIDLDHFKNINDTMGHSAGDELLVNVAERLQRLMRPEDNIARYGGDEFVIILNALDSNAGSAASMVQKISQSILTSLHGSYAIGSGSYFITCSIGTTLFGPMGVDSAELLKQADIALFKAKEAGRDQIGFFDPAWQAAVSERAQWLKDLREGISQHQFELYLQPQQNVSGVVVGAEALVRWNHPQRGLVPPAEFIPLAEESGLILPLGKEIMQMGLDILSRWTKASIHQHLKLSINVSPQQFYEDAFAQTLARLITEQGLTAGQIMLEFTESTLIDDIAQAKQIMKLLNDLGVMFAIDDFGTGYSSLSYLSELPLHQLKIDQSFVRNMGHRQKDRAIVQTIIDMASTMEMQVLAEGVETEAQRDALLSQGCTLFQGYLIAKPMPVGAFEAFLVEHSLQSAD